MGSQLGSSSYDFWGRGHIFHRAGWSFSAVGSLVGSWSGLRVSRGRGSAGGPVLGGVVGFYFLEIRFRSLVNSVCDLWECDGWLAPGVIWCETMSESTTANGPFLCQCFMFVILMIRLRKEMKRSRRLGGFCTLYYWCSLRWIVETHSKAIPSSAPPPAPGISLELISCVASRLWISLHLRDHGCFSIDIFFNVSGSFTWRGQAHTVFI